MSPLISIVVPINPFKDFMQLLLFYHNQLVIDGKLREKLLIIFGKNSVLVFD
jgi:hypothetical protein